MKTIERFQMRTSRERGAVEVCGEVVRYEILIVDARAARASAPGEVLAGNVIVVVPGHGQTVTGPRRLVAEFARLSRSGIAWCIDPTPTRGGDCTEALAIAHIVRTRLSHLTNLPTYQPTNQPTIQPTNQLPHHATIVGWSHGGGEALRAAREDPALFPHYLGICPAGLVERKPPEMVASFLMEATRVVAGDLLHLRLANVVETLRIGANFAKGLVIDLARSRSIRCVIDDVSWACRKVPGPDFDYPGEVVLLLGTSDSVIRWRDPFPGCQTADQLPALVPAFQQANLPASRRLDVRLIDGNHITPELDPVLFAYPGLESVGQLP